MSEYCSATETAQKWGLSGRRVGLLCAQERIPGTTKIGKTWMIPADAVKPADSRREKKAPENSLSADLADLLATISISAPRDNPNAVLGTVSDERIRVIHEGSIAYLRGDFERSIRCFHKHEGDDAAKLIACLIAIPAAISTGDHPLFIEIEIYLKDVAQANISEEVTAFAELALTSAYLCSIATNMVPSWLKDGDFSALPPQMKPEAAYKRVKYFQCLGQYETMLAVAQTTLNFCGSKQEISFPDTYMRLMCAVACYNLDRANEAKRWLLDAMNINLPHGFITPFAEFATELGGMVEELLKQEYPAYYDAVIEQLKRTIPNWVTFHNLFTKDNITSILSLRDCHIAKLAAQGVPYKKIAEQFHMSLGTLNNKM